MVPALRHFNFIRSWHNRIQEVDHAKQDQNRSRHLRCTLGQAGVYETFGKIFFAEYKTT
jgi:hypothetical protein